MTDLNTLVPPNSPFLIEALGINDRGQIAGYALLSNGEVHGYLLTPCGEDDESCGKGVGENVIPQTSPTVSNASNRTLPQSLLRRMNRYRFSGRAFGPRN